MKSIACFILISASLTACTTAANTHTTSTPISTSAATFIVKTSTPTQVESTPTEEIVEPSPTPTAEPTLTPTEEPTPIPEPIPTPELKILENWEEMGIALDGIVISPRISSYKDIQVKDGTDSFKLFSVMPNYPGIVIAFREIDTGVYENWIGVIINGKSFEMVALSAKGRLSSISAEVDTLTELIDIGDINNGIDWAHPLRGLQEELDSDYLDRLQVEQPALYKMLSELEVDPNGHYNLENFFNYGTIPEEWIDEGIFDNGRLDFRNKYVFIG